jgi:two-component system LytT family response regulator
MKYRSLIIEDEPLATIELNRLLAMHPEIEVLAFADSVAVAVNKIIELKPQVLFLDINLNGESGFEVLAALDHVPRVIFITAYDQYAIKAFEVNAIDYLLKPVHPQRLAEAIEKLKKISNYREPAFTIDKRIFIKDGENCHFVKLADIFLIESIGNYARVYYHDKKPMLHRSLNYLEEKLPPEIFFRTGRQHIINTSFIKNIYPFFNSTLQVEMQNGEKIEISQRQSIKFKELMGI